MGLLVDGKGGVETGNFGFCFQLFSEFGVRGELGFGERCCIYIYESCGEGNGNRNRNSRW
jgi:hypothetical protein